MQAPHKHQRGSAYSKFIGILTHLIYTQPEAIKEVLETHGVRFSSPLSQQLLIGATVDMLSKRSPSFDNDLGELVSLHIKQSPEALLAYEAQEDQFLGGLVGGLAKKLVGGIFKKRKKRGGSRPAPTANNVKNDMNQQLMQFKLEQQRREAEARRREEREAAERRRREEREAEARRQREEKEAQERKAARKQTQMIMMGVAGLVVLGIIGVVIAKMTK